MKSVRFAAIAALAAGLAACGASPEATIEKSCLRFEKDTEDQAKAKEMCSCMAENMKENLSEADLKKVAAAFKNAKDGDDLERSMKEEGITDAQMMSIMGAAKSCSTEGM